LLYAYEPNNDYSELAETEIALAKQVCSLDQARRAYREDERTGSFAVPTRVRRSVDAIDRAPRRWIERWVWGEVVGPDGKAFIASREKWSHEQKEIPFLQAVLSGRSGDDPPRHALTRGPASPSPQPADPHESPVSHPAPAPGFANELAACQPARRPYNRSAPPLSG
jgi:hypothetical protein